MSVCLEYKDFQMIEEEIKAKRGLQRTEKKPFLKASVKLKILMAKQISETFCVLFWSIRFTAIIKLWAMSYKSDIQLIILLCL